jgi:2-haloacid dehalogenase
VTQDALVFTCRKLGLELTLDAQTQIMGQYARLEAFPENLTVLKSLKTMGLKLAILSNGNPEMLDAVVQAAGMSDLFTQVLSVHTVKKFKTAPEAYQLGPDTLGVPAKDTLFVSSNCWDICGAAWFGYRTFWVNRSNAPLEELGIKPNGQGQSLDELVQFVT